MNRTQIFVPLAVLIFPVAGLRPRTTSGAAVARPAPAPQPSGAWSFGRLCFAQRFEHALGLRARDFDG
jgi:hypothetical protein